MLVSTTYSSSTLTGTSPSQLVLRGTRDGDLAATLSAHQTPSSSRTPKAERLPLFSWSDLVAIVSSGNLQRLSRHPDDLREYFAWMDSVKLTYGSVQAFILSQRLSATYLLQPPAGGAECFQSAFTPGRECQILVNDWPYSIPQDVTHHVVWSYRPILHRNLVKREESEVEEAAWAVVAKRGLCGALSKKRLTVPGIQDHKQHVVDLDRLLARCGEKETEHGAEKVHATLSSACREITGFIAKHWDLDSCDVVFFANPPSLQSVPSLAHFHVLVRPL